MKRNCTVLALLSASLFLGAFLSLAINPEDCCDCQEWDGNTCVVKPEYIPWKQIDGPIGGSTAYISPAWDNMINLALGWLGLGNVSPFVNYWFHNDIDFCCPDTSPSECIGQYRFYKDQPIGSANVDVSALSVGFIPGLISNIIGAIGIAFPGPVINAIQNWLDSTLPSVSLAHLVAYGATNSQEIDVKDECLDCDTLTTIWVGSEYALLNGNVGNVKGPSVFMGIDIPPIDIVLLESYFIWQKTGSQINNQNKITITTYKLLRCRWQVGPKKGIYTIIPGKLTPTPTVNIVCPHW